jgi:hypothetical protein
MNRLSLEQFLVVLQVIALSALCLRMWWTRLYRVYSYFFAYLLLALIQTAVGPFFPVRSALYLYVWMASEGVVVALYGLVVLEAYAIILRDLAGIAGAARQYIKIAIACAVAASLLLVGLEKAPATIPQYFLVCERAVISSLLVFVMLSVLFLAYYPVPLNRNAIAYSIGFAIYLLVKTVALFAVNLRLYLWHQLDTALLGFSAACLLFWVLMLGPAGETKTVVVAHSWGLEEEKHIVSRLKAINESLLRTAKK